MLSVYSHFSHQFRYQLVASMDPLDMYTLISKKHSSVSVTSQQINLKGSAFLTCLESTRKYEYLIIKSEEQSTSSSISIYFSMKLIVIHFTACIFASFFQLRRTHEADTAAKQEFYNTIIL